MSAAKKKERRFLSFQVWMTEQEADTLRKVLNRGLDNGLISGPGGRDAERCHAILVAINEAQTQAECHP